MEATYLCITCGKDFIPVRLAQKFCSKKCRDKSSGEDRRFSGIRDYIIRRDKFQCKTCGKKEGLVVHHKDWIRTNNVPDNLVTLCRSCHKKEHFETTDNAISKVCIICGSEFHPLYSKREVQVLCRRAKCSAKYKVIQKRSTHETVGCIICGQPFTQKHSRQVCCSAGCTGINNDRKKAERYALNREELKTKQIRYYENNKEERKAYIKKWQAENPEKVKAYKEKNALKRKRG